MPIADTERINGMDIKERRLLNKIKKLHYSLLHRLNLGDKDYEKTVMLYRNYHNNLNVIILEKELFKRKQ